MMSVVSRLTVALIVILAVLSSAAVGLSQSSPAKSSDFNIEILNLDDPSDIFSIPEPPHHFSYFAHVNLKSIPDWKPSAEVLSETSALRVQFWLQDGTPQIEVMAYLGKLPPNSRPSEWDQNATAIVKSVALPADQLVTITETKKYGIAPFQVKVSRVEPWIVDRPEVINKTQAIDVITISESRPHYILTIRNVSHKGIDAIHWYYGSEYPSRRSGSRISGSRVIAPGAIFELRQDFVFRDQNQKADSAEWRMAFVISAIVFDDGNFEGSPDHASEMAANISGDRVQLKRIKALVTAVAPSELRNPEGLQKLRTDIAALSEAADAETVNELKLRFATATEDMRNRRIKEAVVNGMRATKNHFVRQLEKLEFQRLNSSDAEFENSLKDLLKAFQRLGRS
jgi:hypothetical protein